MELSKYDKVELTVKVLIFGPNNKLCQIWQVYSSILLPVRKVAIYATYMAILDRPFSTLPTRQLPCWRTYVV